LKKFGGPHFLTTFVAYLTVVEKAFRFEESFGRILGVAHTSLFRHLSKLLKDQNVPITPEQFSVLSHLWQKDGVQQTELAVCTNRNRANVTRILDILERESIIERRDDAQDRRVFRIFLTQKGRSLRDAAAKCAEQSINDALEGLTNEEINACKTVLIRVTQNVS
jgi:DNA-binding MarR family transcriptional regulator